ncbi:Helix-turn-helix domain-containing protein [Mucilaginibacter sp. OK268]|uniref:AraC family transcriptional regulator n=2 Tax=Pseudomonadati TaxID=3379134 RepID=UPI000891A407|nr:helix-turn-helix domain-containing protein [Mucilaginibacter sp. OK268]SDP21682.1 Helix-turn-helix domain-containing protein [Mucilaginibacter sp. OK268]
MNYQVIAPPPSLKKHVRYFWTLENQTDDVSQKTFTVMSNGEPGLIFQQDPRIFTGFKRERLPQLFVFGQATRYGQLHGSGSFSTIGVSFQPTALKSMFGLNANELTDQSTCISQLAKTSLTEQLLSCSSTQQQVSCLSVFLQKQKQHDEGENKKLGYAVNALQRGKKLPRILYDLNLSERSLERLFLTHIGITPILYARICRFQTSVALLRKGEIRSLTDIAYTLGYFDQSHFIRDFKIFSGVSPSIYLRKAIERMPGFPEWES